jgi:crotonobetainyl-CoA:carnitine CoA-transferase CaiB-like acyl-CoA transferase
MNSDATPPAIALLQEIWLALGGSSDVAADVAVIGEGDAASVFAVADLAAATIGVAGVAVADLVALRHGGRPRVRVDRRLSSMWFASSLRPQGWAVPPSWDAIAGDYRGADGWIRLHTNAPHHRDVALATLGVPADKPRVAHAVSRWTADALETAIVERGGCAAAMRSIAEWAVHAQGRAVAVEPLLHLEATDAGAAPAWVVARERPLRGIRVLDLTRVLAGPVATRCLAGFGADVLRIDPPWWDEPGVVPEVTLGKRCARLDLRDGAQRAVFERLLSEADVLVHGYRSDALDRLGLSAERRRQIRPGLVDVALDAYGWTGPWRKRRGFDSLVQMSTGIADAGMRRTGSDHPVPLPVQALDHAAGYLMAAAVVRGLAHRLANGRGCEARASLARTAALLAGQPVDRERATMAPEQAEDQAGPVEATTWGPARRLKPPLAVQGAPMCWDLAAGPLGVASPTWSQPQHPR